MSFMVRQLELRLFVHLPFLISFSSLYGENKPLAGSLSTLGASLN